MTDWGQAAFIGGTGFATVFVVLTALAVMIALVGKATGRFSRGEERPTQG